MTEWDIIPVDIQAKKAYYGVIFLEDRVILKDCPSGLLTSCSTHVENADAGGSSTTTGDGIPKINLLLSHTHMV